jgi:hypothetical protein
VTSSLTPEQRALLARRLAQRRAASPTTIPRRSPDAVVPLSPTQRSMWLLAQLDATSVAYNHIVPYRVTGPLDVAALHDALRSVVRRHESLRSVVAVGDDGVPTARIIDAAVADPPLSIARCDSAEPGELDALLRAEARRPFDLERDLPLRLLVVQHDDQHHTVGFIAHHIALDNLSMALIQSQLIARLAGAVHDDDGDGGEDDEARLQYGDFAVWLDERLAGDHGDELAAFWRAALGEIPALELPLDRARPATQQFEGGRVPVALDATTAAAVRAAARAAGVTEFMFLFAAFAVLLYRWSGQPDFAVGTPFANRDRVELEALVGFVNNTLAVPVHLRGQPRWRDALAAARTTLLDAFAHGELPFERVVHEVNPPRDASRNPIFQVNFRVAPTAPAAVEAGGLRWERSTIDLGYSKFDLALELHVGADGIGGHVEYNSALFDDTTAAHVAEAYATTLAAVTSDPDVPVLALPAVARSSSARSGPMRRARPPRVR